MKKPSQSKFDMSHERKMTLNMAWLIPFFIEETLPGDRWRVFTEIMMRMFPLKFPLMHRVDIWTHYFWVPYRQVMEEFEDFMTGGVDGEFTAVVPQISYQNMIDNGLLFVGDLTDYFGLPSTNSYNPGATLLDPINISVMQARAYQRIWAEYFMDRNNETTNVLDYVSSGIVTDPAEIAETWTMRKRCWQKDLFTSALATPQRGDQVLIPMEGNISYMEQSIIKNSTTGNPATSRVLFGQNLSGSTNLTQAQSANVSTNAPDGSAFGARVENIASIENTSITIADLRTAVALQHYLEVNSVGGSRYNEQLLVRWGVTSDDLRLQRPQYLGGSKQPMSISEVLNTNAEVSDPENALGSMAGHGISFGNKAGFRGKFKEHGVIIGIMSVLPKTGYQDGVEPMFTRFDKLDWPVPELAHVGEQAIKRREVFYSGMSAAGTNDQTFGYTPRYVEWKYRVDKTFGQFKTTLVDWHMNRIFQVDPTLPSIMEADPTMRIFAVTDPEVHHLLAQIYHKADVIRKLPYFGTPALVG